jgi:hypothetical protein
MLPAPTTRTRAAGLAAMMFLAACSRHEASPPPQPAVRTAVPAPAAAPAPAPASTAAKTPTLAEREGTEWMRAIFEDAYDPAKERALVGEDGARKLMTLASGTRLADGRTVVIVNGAFADENGNDTSGYGSPGLLNVYFLKRNDKGWDVLERREDAAEAGLRGDIGGVEWVTLGSGKQGFILGSGGMWQGYLVATADIFVLDDETRHLGMVRTMSDNDGNCLSDSEDCWSVEGDIRFDTAAQSNGYADMLIDYHGKHYRVTEGGDGKQVEHVTSTVKQTSRWRFDGKQYVLVSGTDPMPQI